MQINYPNTDQRKFLYVYLDLLGILKGDESLTLSKQEKLVLIEFLLLPVEFKYYKFSLPGKKKVMSYLNTHTEYSVNRNRLNTIIYNLIEKGWLYRDEDKVIFLRPFLEKALRAYDENQGIDITVKFRHDNKAGNRDNTPDSEVDQASL